MQLNKSCDCTFSNKYWGRSGGIKLTEALLRHEAMFRKENPKQAFTLKKFLCRWHYSLSIPIYIYVWAQLFFRSFCWFVISLKAKREPIREEFTLGTNYSCDTQLVSSPIIPHSSVQCLVHTCVLVTAILVLKNAFATWTPAFGTTMPICNISIWCRSNSSVNELWCLVHTVVATEILDIKISLPCQHLHLMLWYQLVLNVYFSEISTKLLLSL